jgi:pseudouridine-5'-phosphate glycosidase
MARRVEDTLRAKGVTPATVALFGGLIHVGVDAADLASLAQNSQHTVKTSRRDMAAVLRDPRAVGGTTVSATMIAAQMAGIPVFVTGGIGGVHRGAAETMDIRCEDSTASAIREF